MKKFCAVLIALGVFVCLLAGCADKATDAADFKYTVTDEYVYILGYTGEEKKVVIPEKIEGKPVKGIGFHAFLSSDIESVTIPSTVVMIGEMAFANCSKLHTVKLNANITEIESEVFKKCVSLKNINIPSTVTKIDHYAFSECEALEKIAIPKSVTQMGMGAFFGNKSLTEIEFEEGIKKIGSFAVFQACTSLKSVTIPSGVEEIGDTTFRACDSLKTVKFLGDAPEKVGDYVFGPPNKNIEVHYSKDASGWDNTSLSDYTLVEY